MTITNQTSSVSVAGSGVAGQVVPFDFPVLLETELVVKTITADGVETTLSLNTGFTVCLSETSEGGTVTLAALVPATDSIYVIRATTKTQELDLSNGGSFNADAIEASFDKVTKMCIENANAIASTTGYEIAPAEMDVRAYLSENIMVYDNEVLCYDNEILLA